MAKLKQIIWKKIQEEGIADFYQVNNYGQVRSLPHSTTFDYQGCTGNVYSKTFNFSEKILVPTIDGMGYCHVRLQTKDGKSAKLFKLHRLVAKYFLTEYDEELTVDHIDNNKENNAVANLKMLGKWENLDKFRQELHGNNHLYTDGKQQFCSFKKYCKRHDLDYSKYYFIKAVRSGQQYQYGDMKFKQIR